MEAMWGWSRRGGEGRCPRQRELVRMAEGAEPLMRQYWPWLQPQLWNLIQREVKNESS
jgi:hypothetical protein